MRLNVISSGKDLLFLALYGQVKKIKSVPNKIKLYSLVKRAIRAKTRQVIDFNQPWFELLIYHDVHTEYLEAHRIL